MAYTIVIQLQEIKAMLDILKKLILCKKYEYNISAFNMIKYAYLLQVSSESPVRSHHGNNANDLCMQHTECPVLQIHDMRAILITESGTALHQDKLGGKRMLTATGHGEAGQVAACSYLTGEEDW